MQFYVYILASKSRRLYVGVTNDLMRRVYQHLTGVGHFTSRYRINRLVYFEEFGRPIEAIASEKRIKRMLRAEKIALIQSRNPAWDNLAEGWFEESSSRFTRADPRASPGG